MNRDEFVKKFKVGDTIECGLDSSVKILLIGEQGFYGLNVEYSLEHAYPFDENWTKVQTPKLPSEEINQIRMADTIDAYAVPYSPAEKAIIVWLDKNWPNVQMKGEK